MERNDGYGVYCRYCVVMRSNHGVGSGMRQIGGADMNWLLWVSIVVAVALFIYLIAALLKPEDFS